MPRHNENLTPNEEQQVDPVVAQLFAQASSELGKLLRPTDEWLKTAGYEADDSHSDANNTSIEV